MSKELIGELDKIGSEVGTLDFFGMKLAENWPKLRALALAGIELLENIEKCNHKYQGEDWQNDKSFDDQVYAALSKYREQTLTQ